MSWLKEQLPAKTSTASRSRGRSRSSLLTGHSSPVTHSGSPTTALFKLSSPCSTFCLDKDCDVGRFVTDGLAVLADDLRSLFASCKLLFDLLGCGGGTVVRKVALLTLSASNSAEPLLLKPSELLGEEFSRATRFHGEAVKLEAKHPLSA